MPKMSAGLLVFRNVTGGLEVFLVHPGGPFWAKKDDGAWSIPKGEFDRTEEPLVAAKREFEEETGFQAENEMTRLEPIRQPSGKTVYAWAMEGDCDPASLKSNTFLVEWPPKSGQQQEFPEVDRAEWFLIDRAKEKIHKGQVGFLLELQGRLTKDNRDPTAVEHGGGVRRKAMDDGPGQRSLFDDSSGTNT